MNKYWKKVDEYVNSYFLAFTLILAVSTFLRFKYAFFDGMWVDEGRYARLALDVASHPLQYSTEAPLQRSASSLPPVFPYLLAISTYIFSNADFAVRIVSPLTSVGAIAVTYKLGEKMKNEATGLIAAGLLALIPTYWFLSERILVEATLTLTYSAAIFALYYGFSEREYSKYAIYALGPLTGLAIMTKQPAYTLGPVILLYTVYKKREALRSLYDSFEFDLARKEFGDLGVAVLLGALSLVPWMINNMYACGFPLCGFLQAISFSASSGSANAAIFSVQSSFYFLTNLASIASLPVAALVAIRVGHLAIDRSEDSEDMMKRGGAIIALTILAFLLDRRLAPMFLVSSISLLAKKDYEKLLWIWTGIGIGFMSIPGVKVPRYIAFVFPALSLLAAMTIYNLSSWIGKITDRSAAKYGAIVGIILFAVIFTYPQGNARMQQMNNPNSPVATMGPVGEWLDQNTSEDAKMVAPSNRQMMFYAYPRLAWFPDDNQTEFERHLVEEDIDYVIADTYEKAQPEWMQYIPPFRVPNSQRQGLRSGQITPQQVGSQFRPPPDYLVTIESFGQARMPLTQNRQQPQFIIYRVNQSALR